MKKFILSCILVLSVVFLSATTAVEKPVSTLSTDDTCLICMNTPGGNQLCGYGETCMQALDALIAMQK